MCVCVCVCVCLSKGEDMWIHEEVVIVGSLVCTVIKRRSGMKQRRLTFCKYFCMATRVMNLKLLQVIDDNVSNTQL